MSTTPLPDEVILNPYGLDPCPRCGHRSIEIHLVAGWVQGERLTVVMARCAGCGHQSTPGVGRAAFEVLLDVGEWS